MILRKYKCKNCGNQAQKPTEYYMVHCDACGGYLDCDLRVLLSMPAEAYSGFEKKEAELDDDINRAVKDNDQDRYVDLQKELYGVQIDEMPLLFSKKMSDPAYREGYLDWFANNNRLLAFHPEAVKQMEILNETVANLKFDTLYLKDPPMTAEDIESRVRSKGFWKMVGVYRNFLEETLIISDKEGVSQLFPDPVDDSDRSKVAYSAMLQGWARYLHPEDTSRYMKEFNLIGDYIFTEEPNKTNCSGCGGELSFKPGTQETACIYCGRKIDLTAVDYHCSGCRAPLSFPKGKSTVCCPYCANICHATDISLTKDSKDDFRKKVKEQ